MDVLSPIKTAGNATLDFAVLITAFGGKDDHNGQLPASGGAGTNFKVAFDAIKVAHPAGCRVVFPFTNTGIYYCSETNLPAGYFNGFELDVDSRCTLRFADESARNSPLVKYVRLTQHYYESSKVSYLHYPRRQRSFFGREKTHQMANADRHAVTVSAIVPSDAGFTFFDQTGVDNPFTTSTKVTATASVLSFNIGATPANTMTCAMLPAYPGREYHFHANVPSNYNGNLMLGVKTTGGYDFIADVCNTATVYRFEKEGTAAASFSNITNKKEDAANNLLHQAKNSVISIRVISPRSFVITMNGIVRHINYQTKSEITHILLGAGYGSVAATITFEQMAKTVGKNTLARAPIRLLIVGDSNATGYFAGQWPYWLAEALEGYCGVRVREVRNLGVGGHKVSDQQTQIAATNLSDIDLCVANIGTNDVQNATAISTFITNYSNMLATLNNAGIPVVGTIPPCYWSYTEAGAVLGNRGAVTGNPQGGRDIRAALLPIFATNKPWMNKLSFAGFDALGYFIPAHAKSDSTIDALVFDNIHNNDQASRQLGYELAHTAAALLNPITESAYPINAAQSVNGYTPELWPTVYSNGYVSIKGSVALLGDTPDNTVVAHLQDMARPLGYSSVTALALREDNFGTLALGQANVFVRGDGDIAVFGVPKGATVLYIDSAPYQAQFA